MIAKTGDIIKSRTGFLYIVLDYTERAILIEPFGSKGAPARWVGRLASPTWSLLARGAERFKLNDAPLVR